MLKVMQKNSGFSLYMKSAYTQVYMVLNGCIDNKEDLKKLMSGHLVTFWEVCWVDNLSEALHK